MDVFTLFINYLTAATTAAMNSNNQQSNTHNLYVDIEEAHMLRKKARKLEDIGWQKKNVKTTINQYIGSKIETIKRLEFFKAFKFFFV